MVYNEFFNIKYLWRLKILNLARWNALENIFKVEKTW